MNAFFGTGQWAGKDLLKLYEDQLRNVGAKYVLKFHLFQDNAHKYSIYFGTKNLVGCDKMKQAIWKNCPLGDFTFRGSETPGFEFALDNTDALWAQLVGEFGGETVAYQTVERFVQSDQTQFHTGHLTQKTLQPKEKEGKISIHRPLGGRAIKSKGVKITFPETP